MSRALLTIVLCLLITAPTHAMRYEGAVVKAGAGFMFSDAQYSFDGADRLEGDTQIGATAGISTIWRTSRNSPWMLVLGLDWTQRGYSGTRVLPDFDTELVEVDVLADYISVPVHGRVHFLEEDLTVYALFGPSLEFRIQNDEDALLDELKNFGLGISAGLGFEYELARKKAVQIELRYYLDLLDGWDGDDLYTVTQQRHQALMVTGGFRF
jgi:hypothetical protein